MERCSLVCAGAGIDVQSELSHVIKGHMMTVALDHPQYAPFCDPPLPTDQMHA